MFYFSVFMQSWTDTCKEQILSDMYVPYILTVQL